MKKSAAVKGSKSVSSRARAKATTFRLDPQVQAGLVLLQGVLKKPLNKLVNAAVAHFVERRTAEVETDLVKALERVRAYRRSDPDFTKAMAEFVDAEARWGDADPVEGGAKEIAGPAQAMVHELLRD